MQFGLSEEQILLLDNVNRFLDDNSPLDRVRLYADGGDDADIWAGLAHSVCPPYWFLKHTGGIGLNPLDAAIVAESLGAHITPSPFLGTAVMAPTAWLPAAAADDLLAEIAAGTHRVGIAFSEAIKRRNDAQWKLRTVAYLANPCLPSAVADSYLVADQNKHLYLVAAQDPGLTRKHLTTVDKTRRTVELTYDDVAAQCISTDIGVFKRVLDIGKLQLLRHIGPPHKTCWIRRGVRETARTVQPPHW